MNKIVVNEVVIALDRSHAKITGLNTLLEAYQKSAVGSSDKETAQVLGAIKLIFFDISIDLEKTRKKLAVNF